ncbi:MAG: CoA transferase [Lewinellaceae bacterium]|nr:CoA transferase [Lewinellaceae bacterium]
MPSNQPFAGITIIELASVLAGPAVGMFFAELGARVIKIENRKTGGDVTRRWKLPTEDPQGEFSAYYASVNYGKEVLLVDLADPEDRAWLDSLLMTADVVLSNFRPAAAQRLGLDFASLHQRFPRLIQGEITGFGDDDPDRPAFDMVLQAEAGFLYMCGEPGRNPVKMPVALIDLMAAHQLKEGLLLALWEREKTGLGSRVHCSLLAAALASLANQATNWLMGATIPQPMGSCHPNIAPYGDIYRCADGKSLVLAIGTEAHFRCLCQVLELEKLILDTRFTRNAERVRYRDALNALLAPAIVAWERDVLMTRLNDVGVPAGAVRNMAEVLSLPGAERSLLIYTLPDGTPARCLRTVAFDWESGASFENSG